MKLRDPCSACMIFDATTNRTISSPPALLETDRPWAAYPLADLEPGFFEHCRWFVPADKARAIVLVYSAFSIPVLVLVGPRDDLDSIMDEAGGAVADAQELYFVVRPDALPLLSNRYLVRHAEPMIRMLLDPARVRRRSEEGVVRLGPSDGKAVDALYHDGDATREAPDFYLPAMLGDGVYYGVREGGALVAVAGTHIVAPHERVAGLGNIYTRRDHRGWGLCEKLTSAVIRELLEKGMRTIVLNVRADNGTAIRIYERLGFRHYCDYYEAVVWRPGSTAKQEPAGDREQT